MTLWLLYIRLVVQEFIELLINVVLVLVAAAGVFLLWSILIVSGVLILGLINRDTLTTRMQNTGSYLRAIAVALDITGNVLGAPLFNALFIAWDAKVRFGVPRQTISYVIAESWQNRTLTLPGKWLADFLIWIDFKARQKGSNHLLIALEHERDYH